MGVSHVNFLLRALPQPLVKDVADDFDDLMRETFVSISCAVLPDRVYPPRGSSARLDTRLPGTGVDFR
jgi:hypothetical protein